MTFAKKYWVWIFLGLVAFFVILLLLANRTPHGTIPESGSQPTPTNMPLPTATPTQEIPATPTLATSPPSALAISNLQSIAAVSLYDLFEVRFSITGTVATNLQWPYDPGPVIGMSPASLRTGITVDGLFLPPGQTDWSAALVQPAFLYQPYLTDRDTTAGTPNSEWIYPAGDPYWLVRFAPRQSGDWQFKIRLQDDSTYPGWSETAVTQFTVSDAPPGIHGFVQVSPRDPRYFEYSDGAPYTGTGINASDRGIYISEQQAEGEFRQRYAAGQLNLARTSLATQLVFSRGTHEWDAWRTQTGTSDNLRSAEQVYQDHDFSIKLSGDDHYIFQASNGNQRLAGGLEAGKTYLVQVTAYLGATPASNLTVRLLSSPENFNAMLQDLAPDGWTATDLGSGWKRYQASFTNTQGRLVFNGRAALAVGVTEGTAFLDEIVIGEDLGNGVLGPNVVFKGNLNYHQVFDPLASANWDLIFSHAEASGLALKVIISEKQDFILNRLRPSDGIFDPSLRLNPENFYSQRGYKARRLQEYYWRYLAARWGFSRGVHSWELLNEGDPASPAHRDQALHFGEVMHALDPNHLVTTSFWAGFPADFWGATTSLDYADLHAYISTGASISPGLTDDPSLESDSAQYHLAFSQATREQLTAVGRVIPILRGEAGLDTFDRQREQPALADDAYGVWLHTFIWAMLDPGGLYELYWWSDNLRFQPGPDGDPENGLFEVFAPYNEFMANIPLNTGGYVDLRLTPSPGIRVVGQQNNQGDRSDRLHLWIASLDYTWKNVVEGGTPGLLPNNLSGTLTLSGMLPETTFPVEWWDFNARGQLRIRRETLTSDSSGQLILNLAIDPLDGLPVTDTAVKLGTY